GRNVDVKDDSFNTLARTGVTGLPIVIPHPSTIPGRLRVSHFCVTELKLGKSTPYSKLSCSKFCSEFSRSRSVITVVQDV
ncbi:unnamed protein product, partial [Nesidiocoris tenuis]